jgi:hypothetical protein
MKIEATTVTATTNTDIGRIRRILRAQNCGKLTVLVVSTSRRRRDVIRNPEITKKTSTPMNPPAISVIPA